ncbi:DUF1217 domain-containing protein [Rhodoblastus acidophilus]|uniref:DUF1217 domain-containing protein n=1 Tax=Candidatus Rhodoblastus alkanivorans TaxID=2954117 RepID=A0ABS9Z4D7_9HYPH|nr:DUF1217 domain-containing protein [Candidatus Rhodoblastus alkanivorans]MCI4678846.1 DUF1217 domain-containing protein [Candidatus Rhodoblastus alkanivorans]MCI4682235.1 DUF1217 domain-containing protein [Candidatus Rhodoblastus alkanivorans]MDI4639537.1 DUF1217 domain-containing protein [Rhodoblastus acidophilus]
MSTFTDYMTIANNLSRYQTMTAADPTVAQATKYFQANIGNIKTADDFVNNTRIFNYVMTAFGLSDMTYAKSLIKQVLEQGTSRSTALANTLNNPKILALAQAFNFSLYGDQTTQTTAATSDAVNQYVMQTLETNEGNQNPGVELALYFQQNASKITNGYSILADKNLLTVVQTTLGISSYTSAQNIDLQAQQFDRVLKYSDFQNPTKVFNFLERFTAQYDFNNPNASAAPSSSLVTTLFDASSSSSTSISVNLLMSMQNLKLGGL